MKTSELKNLKEVRCELCGSTENIKSVYFLDKTKDVVVYCDPCQDSVVNCLKATFSKFEEKK